MILKPAYQQWLRDLSLDLNLVGEFVSKGKQHYVYRYGSDQVIKIPRQSLYMQAYGKISPGLIRQELELLQKYFGDFYLPTTLITNQEKYALIQAYLEQGRPVLPQDVVTWPDQFSKLSQAMQLVRQEGFELDIFGYVGMTKTTRSLLGLDQACLTNILINQDKLQIVDTNLSVRWSTSAGFNGFHRWMDWWTAEYGRLLLKLQFGVG